MATDAQVTKPAEEEGSGLPKWLDDMLKPGVSQGIFTTLKASLVGLVLVLSCLLYVITDDHIRLHVSIFLGMSVVLLVLVIWFVGELQKEQAAQPLKDKKL
jgi:FtsH-binding integral membrane protein